MKWGAPATTALSRTPGPLLRLLAPGDERAFELFLERHWTTSVTLRANIKAAGIEDLGQPLQGTYFAAWEGATIVGAAAHYTNDVVVLQAPRALNQIVRGVVAASNRAIAAVQGPWPQVEAAVAALGLKRDKMTGKAQILSTLDLAKMIKPEALKRELIKVREARAADVDRLLPWYSAYHGENTGFVEPSEAARDELQRQIEARAVFVAETDRPVAMTTFEVWQGDTVKIGAVYTPPAMKNKGYGSAAVAGALLEAQSRGIARATILCDKADTVGQRAFGALGFTTLSDYGILRRPQ